MGRTQSAMAILGTVIQLIMSFALGIVAERAGIIAGYALLALLYAGATLFAMKARQLQLGASWNGRGAGRHDWLH
jgi:hypothetical protein